VLAALPPQIERVARTNFYIARDYPDHKTQVAALYSHPDFFFGLNPIEGAVDGWGRLLHWGLEPRVCTAPLTLNASSRDGKLACLEEHLVPRFGPRVIDHAIFDKNKHEHHALALIDDRPDLDTGGGTAAWRHVVFDQPYNQQCPSAFRVRGWNDRNFASVLEDAIR
jgi:5'-nucleotidase